MARLEDLTRGATVRGILPNSLVTVIDVKWYGTSVIELTYKDAGGRPGNQLIYRDNEARLEVVTAGRPAPWARLPPGRIPELRAAAGLRIRVSGAAAA